VRRVAGLGCVLLGIVAALWLALGPPRDWEGGMRWLRQGLAWGSVGVVALAARLVFPDRSDEKEEAFSS
jgi:hypothetical protein